MVTKKDKPENVYNDDVVIKRDPEIVKRETAALAKKKSDELAKQDTGGLVKKITGELAKKITQPLQESAFTWEETAWLVVFVLVILVSIFLPQQSLDDHEVAFLLFVVAPVMVWFIRLIYLDEKRQKKIR
jgi:Flp pilus assembly protein TadB